jgi:hypothetical protein
MDICVWKFIENDGYWETDCKHTFWLDTGTPFENKFEFCPYCGKELVEDAPEKEDESYE